jgi:hypothetical protein
VLHRDASKDARPRRDGVRGWLAIRGISDRADVAKGHGYHAFAAGHSAEVMAMLLPYLYFGAGGY